MILLIYSKANNNYYTCS